jgi:hypothetical protein
MELIKELIFFPSLMALLFNVINSGYFEIDFKESTT